MEITSKPEADAARKRIEDRIKVLTNLDYPSGTDLLLARMVATLEEQMNLLRRLPEADSLTLD